MISSLFRKKRQKTLLYFGPALIDYPAGLRVLALDPFVLKLLEQADALVTQKLNWSPLRRLKEDKCPETFVHEDYIINECLFQLCLFEKWKTKGLDYHLVAGYSLGEVPAIRAAGFYSFDQAVDVCCAVVEGLREPKDADLMTIFASVTDIRKIAEENHIHCYHSIDNRNRSTWSGLVPELTRLQNILEPLSIKTQRFYLHCASHSPLVGTGVIRKRLQDFKTQVPAVPYFSSVTGALLRDAPEADFWVRMITSPCLSNEMNAVLGEQSFDQIVRFGSMQTELKSILGKMKNTVSIYNTSESLKHP
jgi:acyl transferase domain-containing protein